MAKHSPFFVLLNNELSAVYEWIPNCTLVVRADEPN